MARPVLAHPSITPASDRHRCNALPNVARKVFPTLNANKQVLPTIARGPCDTSLQPVVPGDAMQTCRLAGGWVEGEEKKSV